MIMIVTFVGTLIHIYSTGTWPTIRANSASSLSQPVHRLDADPRARREHAVMFIGWRASACARSS